MSRNRAENPVKRVPVSSTGAKSKSRVRMAKLSRIALKPFGTYPERAMSLDYRIDAPLIMSQAIHAKCIDCCGWILVEPRRCTAYTCSIWPYRTGTLDQSDNTEAIRKAQVTEGVADDED